MSGSKLLRLCSLFLCLLLCLANFSVVANAGEDFSEVSDLSKWQVASDSDYNVSVDYKYNSTYGYFYRYSITNGFNVGDYATLYSVPDLTVGSTYKFNFSMIHPASGLKFFDYGVLLIGFANFNSDGTITFYEDSYIEFTDPSTQLPDSFTDFEINFTYNGVGNPYLVIWSVTHTAYEENTDLPLYFLDISLTKLTSETDKKLDGILGWLEDIKNSIIGLPETIKTNLSAFFTDLSSKLTELKNNIKTNLETLGNNINGKLGDVSTDFSDYVSGLGDRVSSFFSDLKTNLTSEFTAFKNKVSTEFTNLKSNLTTNFDNLRSTLSSRFDKVDNFLTEIRDFFHNLYWDLVGGTCGAGDVHSSLFERLGDRIRGFFEDLKVKIDIKVEEIKTAIHDFFVPPEGFFEEWKANFDLMLSENLGFIYETPDLITGFVTLAKNILDTDTEPSIIFPEISFVLPGEYGGEINLFEETEVDLSFLSESDVFSFLYYEAYPALLHVILILALIGYAKYIWGRTMSN